MKTRKAELRAEKIRKLSAFIYDFEIINLNEKESVINDINDIKNMANYQEKVVECIDLTIDDDDDDDVEQSNSNDNDDDDNDKKVIELDIDDDVLSIDCDEISLGNDQSPTNDELPTNDQSPTNDESPANDQSPTNDQHQHLPENENQSEQLNSSKPIAEIPLTQDNPVGAKLLTTQTDIALGKPIVRHTFELTMDLSAKNAENAQQLLSQLTEFLAKERMHNDLVLTPPPPPQTLSKEIIPERVNTNENDAAVKPLPRMLCGKCFKIYVATLYSNKCPFCADLSTTSEMTNYSNANVIPTEIVSITPSNVLPQEIPPVLANSHDIIVSYPSDDGTETQIINIPMIPTASTSSTTFNEPHFNYNLNPNELWYHQSTTTTTPSIINVAVAVDSTYTQSSLNDNSIKVTTVTDSNKSLLFSEEVNTQCQSAAAQAEITAPSSQSQIPTAIMYKCRTCNTSYNALQTNNCCPNCMPVLIDNNNYNDGADQLIAIQYEHDYGTYQQNAVAAESSSATKSPPIDLQIPGDLDASCFLDTFNSSDFITQAVEDNLTLMTTEQHNEQQTKQAQTLASYFGFFDSTIDDLNQQESQITEPIINIKSNDKMPSNICYTRDQVSVVLWNCDPLVEKYRAKQQKRKKRPKRIAGKSQSIATTSAKKVDRNSKKAKIAPLILKKKVWPAGKDMSKFRPEDWQVVTVSSDDDDDDDYAHVSATAIDENNLLTEIKDEDATNVENVDMVLENMVTPPSMCALIVGLDTPDTGYRSSYPSSNENLLLTQPNVMSHPPSQQQKQQQQQQPELQLSQPPSLHKRHELLPLPVPLKRKPKEQQSEQLKSNHQPILSEQNKCTCNNTPIRSIENDKISIVMKHSSECQINKSNKQQLENQHTTISNTILSPPSLPSTSTGISQNNNLNSQNLLTCQTVVDPCSTMDDVLYPQNRIYAGRISINAETNRPIPERKRTSSENSDCLSITMSEDLSYLFSPNRPITDHFDQPPKIVNTKSSSNNNDKRNIDPTKIVINCSGGNSNKRSRSIQYNETTINSPFEPSKLINQQGSSSSFNDHSTHNRLLSPSFQPLPQLTNYQELSFNDHSSYNRALSKPFEQPQSTNHRDSSLSLNDRSTFNRVLSTPYEPPQLTNHRDSLLPSIDRSTFSRVLSTPFEPPQLNNHRNSSLSLNQKDNLIDKSEAFRIPKLKNSSQSNGPSSSSSLPNNSMRNSAPKTIHNLALKLFSYPCLKYINDICSLCNCSYNHILPDSVEVLNRLQNITNDFVVKIYDHFVIKYDKIFFQYFQTFAMKFGQLKNREKLITMIWDCEDIHRNCVNFFDTILCALMKCDLTKVEALQTILNNRRSTSTTTYNKLIQLIIDTSIIHFTKFLDQFANDPFYVYNNELISKLMNFSLQCPQRSDVIKILLKILEDRKTIQEFWKHDSNLYSHFINMVNVVDTSLPGINN